MTDNRTARLYVATITVSVLFLTWATIAANPWQAKATANASDERLVALEDRARLLRSDLAQVREIAARAQAARGQSVAGMAGATAATSAPAATQPRVRIVELPPLVITRSS